mgnify:CR=1 FL=1
MRSSLYKYLCILSENGGGKTRGICCINEREQLVGVNETSNIIKTPTGAKADGKRIDPKFE